MAFISNRPVSMAAICVLVALTAIAGIAQAAPQAKSKPKTADAAVSAAAFYVPVNRSELITTNTDIGEVLVADPEVANVVVHGRRKISVLGVAVGQTSLRVLDTSHRVVRTTDVYVTYDLPSLRRALKEFLPQERVGVSMVNTRIALTGDVSSAQAAQQAIEIATEFVRGKLPAAQAETRRADSGQQNDSPVINLMKVAAGQQVMLRIKIGEVNRSVLRNLGVNLRAIGEDGFSIATGLGPTAVLGAASQAGITAATDAAKALASVGVGATPTTQEAAAIAAAGSRAANAYSSNFKNRSMEFTRAPNTFGTFGGSVNSANRSIGAQIDALEETGVLKILAEPTLTALSGEEAQFLAGGEFPIPVPQQLGGGAGGNFITIQYKPFGVALKFIPNVLSKNRIRIQVQPEVSDISPENSINANGFNIPSFVTRRASTTVELAQGESFMIAGLLRDDMTSRITQLPGADELPVLGALFRSTGYQRRETELVISVTPYLVDPLRDRDMKLPTDDFRPASFLESLFFGALASNKGGKAPSLEGPAGFMTDN